MALRILLAMDDSATAHAAAEVALDLAARLPTAELTALHVVNVVAPSGSFFKDLRGRLGFEPAVVPQEVHERYSRNAEDLLQRLEEEAKGRGLEVKTVIDEGSVLPRIQFHAQQADLLIIGNLGETEERFPGQGGSHVYDIVSNCPCPVLVVPEGSGTLRSVVVGYDGSVAASHAVAALRRLTDKIPLDVHAVLVDRGGDVKPDVLNDVAEQLPGATVSTHVVEASLVREGIVKLANEHHVNLLAVGFEGKSRLRDFLFGSTAEYLLRNQSLMLLVAH